jgi:hypothetical protein
MLVNNPEGSVLKVFVSYRREDSAASAGRLGDRLAYEFVKDQVFMDVDSIPLGSDFVKRLADEVQRCDVLLAVIGSQWNEIRDEDGNRRLDDPNDFVRVEIRAALQRDIPVVPILLDGTKIPKATSLPEDIKSLALRRALELGHVSFQVDLDRLVEQLKVRAREVASPFEALFGKVTRTKLALILLLGSCLGALPVVLSRQSTRQAPDPVVTGRIPVPVTSSFPQDWSALAPVSCDEEKNLRASAARYSTKIGFLNNRSTRVQTYWLNDSGARVRYSELAPGQSVEQSTFVTHPWLVADEQDRCIAIYLPNPTPAVALLK